MEIDSKIRYTVALLPKTSIYFSEAGEEEGIKAGEIKPEIENLKFQKKTWICSVGKGWQGILEFKMHTGT